METSRITVNLGRPFSVDRCWQRLQFALLPPRCLLCGGRGESGRDLCAACIADLPRNLSHCARCALPLPLPAPLCGECLEKPPPFDAAFAPYRYEHPLDLLLTRLKFGADLAAGRVLGELWLAALREARDAGRIDTLPQAVVPVPLHTDRLRERGFNQALELARPLARTLRIAIRPELLARTRATAAQSGLDAKARRGNLRGAFLVDADTFANHAVPPDHVAIFDDVMTTGATLRECARALKRAGVARVDVWAVARAPKTR